MKNKYFRKPQIFFLRTQVLSISYTTAMVSGRLQYPKTVAEFGVAYKKSNNSTWNYVEADDKAISVSLSELTPNTNYDFALYVLEGSTYTRSDAVTAKTVAYPTPTLSATVDAESVTADGAEIAGSVAISDFSIVSELGYGYKKTADLTWTDIEVADATLLEGTKSFEDTLTGLDPETSYDVSVYVKSGGTTTRSTAAQFITSAEGGE